MWSAVCIVCVVLGAVVGAVLVVSCPGVAGLSSCCSWGGPVYAVPNVFQALVAGCSGPLGCGGCRCHGGKALVYAVALLGLGWVEYLACGCWCRASSQGEVGQAVPGLVAVWRRG